VSWHASGVGHAGGLLALQQAAVALSAGQAELVLVVAADSYFHLETLAWLGRSARLRGERVRGGFAPGEGAAAILLATPGLARRAGLRSLGSVLAVASATEAVPLDRDTGSLGHALSAAVGEAVRRAGGEVDRVHCDINGERHRVDEWGFTLLRCTDVRITGQPYVTPAVFCGDLGAATGVTNGVLATQAWARHYPSAGERTLIWGGSWSGPRAAVVLGRS
jgi:3-oxoacyl-[acyl-carrier-protein] synthase-1